MKTIAVLDQMTIDKIAAGEVVERPAAVVKELVENAVDAGATGVTVEIKEGGTTLIRITDNGMGIDRDQIPLAFLRHATSKIESVEDLYLISSLGFRGEALSSIAAVSQVELITKTARSLTGVRYVIEGGIEKTLEEIGAPNGTTFLVRNLFYNTPARSKFLKSNMTEAGYVTNYMEQLALSHCNISFKYMVNGQLKMHTSGNGSRKDVIYTIYGRDITKELLPVSWEGGEFKIEGYIGKPLLSRGNRNFENYYVNGRYVKSKIIMKAIEDAYKPFMMKHKYPFTSMDFILDGKKVDINVHPTKMEVRFWQSDAVYQGVVQAVTEALREKEMIPRVSLTQTKRETPQRTVKESVRIPEPFETKRLQTIREAQGDYGHTEKPPVVDTVKKAAEKRINTVAEVTQIEKTQEKPEIKQKETGGEMRTPVSLESQAEDEQLELFDDKLLSKESRVRHRMIGQLFETYWLVEFDNNFYIIDQHAAHEKVLFEQISKDLDKKEVISQYISPPIVMALTVKEGELLLNHMELFTSFGFEIEPFGGKEFCIRAVPDKLYGIADETLFIELLDGLEDSSGKSCDLLMHRFASKACKAAVKGNQTLSMQEAEQLIDELLKLENPYHCPHGRPTIISMTRYELEKKFKRIV